MNELIKINSININGFSVTVGKTYNILQNDSILYDNRCILGIEAKHFIDELEYIIYSKQGSIFATSIVNNNITFTEV